MSTMTEAPAEERRGGKRPDWDKAVPGRELPEKDPELWDPPETFRQPEDCQGDDASLDRDAAPLARWCGHPGCGGD